MRSLHRNRLGTALAAVVLSVGLLTCSDGGSKGQVDGPHADLAPTDRGGTGRIDDRHSGLAAIDVYLTDAPSDYDRVWVTITEVAIHKAEEGWVILPLTSENADADGDGADDVIVNPDGSVTVDLLALQGLEAILASSTIEAGHYTQIRLIISSAEVEDGASVIEVDVPSGSQTGLKITGQFLVPGGYTVSITLDFDAEQSIVDLGNGQLSLQPAIDVESMDLSPTDCTILSVVPPQGHRQGGTLVRIHGSSFDPNGAEVSFGGLPAENVTVLSHTELLATTPPAPQCADLVDVQVTNISGGTCTGAGAYLYVGSPHFLSTAFTIGSDIFLRETTLLGHPAVFSDSYSTVRHHLVGTVEPDTRPSLTMHPCSQWLAWREADSLYARPIWWGPGHTREVYDGGEGTPTAPAIASFNGRLVVVWGVGDTLYMSSSEYGVEWTAPLTKPFPGATVHNPALAVHGDELYIGLVFGPTLFTVLIQDDFSWGPNFPSLTLPPNPLDEVSLASDGVQLSMGFVHDDHGYVIHSPSGYDGWSTPVSIDDATTFRAPPALHYYGGFLYAIYPTGVRVLMRRSPDGIDWATPRFVVDDNAAGALPPVAVTSSDYSVAPPIPQVVALNDSGRPAASTLNLAFVSEGYRGHEMDDYRALVERVANTFCAVNPFSRHLDKFNVYRIDLPSRERGVDASPLMAAAIRQGVYRGGEFQAPVPGFQARYTDTAMGSQYWSCWGSAHYNDDVSQTQSSPNNPRTPQCDAAEDLQNPHDAMTQQKSIHIFGYYAYDELQLLIPGFDPSRDFLYAIVNQIQEDGGTDKASYNPIVSTPDFAEGLGNIHEMGHFTTSLADEDFSSCWPDVASDCDQNANKTANDDLEDPNHRWAHFFVREGRPGDSIVANPASRPPEWNSFWNPAEVNASGIFNAGLWATNGVTDWSGSDGTIIYGPSQQCLMNHTGGNTHFCAVCTEEMTKELLARAGEIFSDFDYHNVYSEVFVEYLHRGPNEPEYPKAGLVEVNGQVVGEADFSCTVVKEREICSVNVTAYISSGTNTLTFKRQPGFTRGIDLLSIQVVNENGAPLALFPITDLSGIGSPHYLTRYYWHTSQGDLDFEF